ncbi:uncharacterized protein EKO05_0002599 [Ascochyta rabiei]|nr:uncharacterized protein EKO05_0002599 [Ascochyta rabiei]UPX12022.1 hypothetical protein EKO05_0002599 [Ascochyta rabiei]
MKQYNRPQPRYDYEIPPELEGVQRALGPDDWTEYIMLSEKYVMGEVTEKELIAGSQRLFCAVNAKLHGRVQNMVVDLMIVPVVGNLAKSEVKKQVS